MGERSTPVGAVDPRRDRLDLVHEGQVEVVERGEPGRLLERGEDLSSEVLGALPAVRDVPRHGAPDAELGAQLPDDLVLAVVVLREGVDRHDRLHAELADDLDVLAQVRQPRPHVARALLEEAVRQRPARSDGESPGVRLHRPHGRDDDGGVRGQTVCAALDVEEPFGAHVGAETGLGDDDLGAGERDPVGDDRARPRRDVPEGAAVDEGRPALEGLEQVRLQRILEQDRHRAGGAEVFGGDRGPVPGRPDDDPPEAFAQVAQVRGEGEQDHHLARRRDVDARLARHPVDPRAKTDDDVAQRAVVHVEAAAPCDAAGVEEQAVGRRLPVVQVVVDHRGEQVVGRGDRVEVAGEVEVEPLHRDDLAVAPAGGAALDAEGGTHRRLPQGDGGALPGAGKALGQPHARRRLPLAERGRGDRRDDDVPPPLTSG